MGAICKAEIGYQCDSGKYIEIKIPADENCPTEEELEENGGKGKGKKGKGKKGNTSDESSEEAGSKGKGKKGGKGGKFGKGRKNGGGDICDFLEENAMKA